MGESAGNLNYSAQQRRDIEAIIAREEATIAANSGNARAPQASYNYGSQAATAQQSNPNAGRVEAFAYSGPAYQNAPNGAQVQRFGIGGAPAPGDNRGRASGQKVGGGLSTVIGGAFNFLRKGPDAAVNFLRGIEDSTGLSNLGVGYRQNPGLNFGRQASPFSFTGSFGGGGNRGGYTNRYASSNGSVYGDANGGRSSHVNMTTSQPWSPQTTGYFNNDVGMFGDATTNLGGKGGIYSKNDVGGVAFTTGFKIANKDFEQAEYAREQHVKSFGSDRDFVYPETVVARLDLTKAVFEASMKNAAAHGDQYGSSLNAVIAGKEYMKEIGNSTAQLEIRPIQDKDTMDAIMVAYSHAVQTNKGVAELTKILQEANGSEKDLRDELVIFSDAQRWATYSSLNESQQSVYNDLSAKTFDDKDAYATQYALLTNKSIWEKGEGVVTDTDKQAFGIYSKGNTFVLRVKDGDVERELVIPADKMEETFALVGKLSIQDVKKDLLFTETTQAFKDLVETYPSSSDRGAFVTVIDDAETLAEQAAKKKQKAEDDAVKRVEEVENEITTRTQQQKDADSIVTKEEKWIKNLESQLTNKKLELENAQHLNYGEDVIGTINSNIAELEWDIVQANTRLVEAQAIASGAAQKVDESQKKLEEANEKLNPEETPVEGQEDPASNVKPTFAQIGAAVDGVIDALGKDPAVAPMIGTVKTQRDTIINGIEAYYNNVEGAKHPSQTIGDSVAMLKTMGLTLQDGTYEAIADAVKQNLNIDVREQLYSNNRLPLDQQQAIDPNHIPSNGNGPALMS